MIVCTCDTCGRIVDNWNVLNINFRDYNKQYQICNDCYKGVKTKFDTFLDGIIVTDKNNNDE